MLRTDSLDYDLPERLIATRPAEPRDSARMLVATTTGEVLSHGAVRDLPRWLGAGDLLVFNTTRVLPARFVGVRRETGGLVRGLYLGPGPGPHLWRCMLRARRFRVGARVVLCDRSGGLSDAALTLIEREGDGVWVVRVEPERHAEEVLSMVGLTPIPPYILSARERAGEGWDDARDREQYQTVYADEPGSVAAPTAGLHFTPALLSALEAAGVGRADVTLHVGAGTFKPVEAEYVEQHAMHAEWCAMGPGAIERVARARERGGRVIAVGTTAARTLEAYAEAQEGGVGVGGAAPAVGGADGRASGEVGSLPRAIETRLLITPGYRWRWVDGLLTNFHLPRSTLMAMVGARLDGGSRAGAGAGAGGGVGDADAGVARLRAIYAEAIAREYRFYSFGDAMLILPERA